MPRKGQTTALERPTGVRGSIQEQPIKPPRNKKRVADENVESNAKTRKRAAFGDLTNVSIFLFSRKKLMPKIKILSYFPLEFLGLLLLKKFF